MYCYDSLSLQASAMTAIPAAVKHIVETSKYSVLTNLHFLCIVFDIIFTSPALVILLYVTDHELTNLVLASHF